MNGGNCIMQCDIIVATHKLFDDSFVPEGYKIVGVGNNPQLDCYQKDDEGGERTIFQKKIHIIVN